MSPFKVLGVPEKSSLEVCKKAYRTLARKYHPDMATGNKAKFQQINEAWEKIQSRNIKPELRQEEKSKSGYKKPNRYVIKHQDLLHFKLFAE